MPVDAAPPHAPAPAARRSQGRAIGVVMLLENNPYPADVRVRAEAESLAAAGYAVRVIAPRASGQARREQIAGVKVERFALPATPGNRAGFFAEYLIANVQLYLRGARALLRGARVVHLHNPPDTLFGVGMLARMLRRRVVFDHHDLAPELLESKFGAGALVTVLRLFERATFRVAHAVLATNGSYAAVALERGRVPADRIAVVRNGPRAATIAPPGDDGRDGVLEDVHVVFLGEMEAQDGVDILPAMLAQLRGRHALAGARLTCIGPGTLRPSLEAAFAQAGLAGAVTFTGRVAHDAVPGLLAQADVCIDPAPPSSLNDRSTMIKIAEYLAAARPVVAFALTETRRTAGDAAIYTVQDTPVALAEAIAGLARDPAARAALVRRARTRAPALTWAHSEPVLLEVYARLCPRAHVADR